MSVCHRVKLEHRGVRRLGGREKWKARGNGGLETWLLVLIFTSYFRPGVSTLPGMCQTWPTIWVCIASELRMVVHFLTVDQRCATPRVNPK